LPWIVAGVALLLYAVTLNHWARLDSLVTLSAAGGWGLYVTVRAPLLNLVTLPVRLLPAGWEAPALNLLAAVMAALTLALLARSVSLLPYDRTNETRLRERSEFSLLSIGLAWVPAALACLALGLQLSFWEHATAFTGEMLDLLLFAYLGRCLLEFRLDRRDGWLFKLAFVYGLGVANNYAMVGFFPCFLVAVIWVKGWEFPQPRFLLRMALAGVLGLLVYLYLPLVNTANPDHAGTFWDHLRAVLGAQRTSLGSMPRYIVLVLSFTSILPVLFLSIPWASEALAGAPGTTIVGLLMRALQVILLAGCYSVFFDPGWSPRALGSAFGVALLPFYYLSAIGLGYFVGYFLLLAQPAKGRGWPPTPGPLESLGKGVSVVALVLLVATASLLFLRNGRPVADANTPALAKAADEMIAALPAEGAYVLSDGAEELLLLEGRLRHKSGRLPHVLMFATWLEYPNYHEQLARRHPGRWAVDPEFGRMHASVAGGLLMARIGNLARSNQVYYLNPSFGYYFEVVRARPQGPIYRLEALDPDPLLPPPLSQGDLAAAERFWEGCASDLELLVAGAVSSPAIGYLRGTYARALNTWGVMLQRHGDLARAARWFDLAVRLNPDNQSAVVNRAYNAELRQTASPEAKPSSQIEVPIAHWDRLLRANGPFDQPRWILEMAAVFARAGLYRQALIEFDRLGALAPANPAVPLWKENMEVMTRLRMGQAEAAEKQALSLQSRFPKEEVAFEALTHVYLFTGRLTNALANVEVQLGLNPTNVSALLNKAAFQIQLAQFPQAIPTLDRLLALQPQNQAALLNRAIRSV